MGRSGVSDRGRVGTRRGRVTVAMIGVAVAGLLVACDGAGEGSSSPSCVAVPSAPTGGTAGSGGQAPGGGGLRVVEEGHSNVSRSTASFGAIVENTSDLVAYRARITFRPLDANGRSAVIEGSGELLAQEIPIILPGQRIGVGSSTYVAEERSQPVTVARVEIEFGAVRWLPEGKNFSIITARHLRTERSRDEADTGSVHYVAESRYCGGLFTRGVVTVFRDSGGAVVGGSIYRDSSRERCQPGSTEEHVMAFRSIPREIDDTKTVTYPYCDFVPVQPIRASGTPFN